MRGYPGASPAGSAPGRKGQLVHRGSSDDGGESDTRGIPAVLRRLGGVEAQAGGRNRGELGQSSDMQERPNTEESV